MSMWRGFGFGFGNGGGEALKTWVRYMSKKRSENLRKINPKVPYPEATSIAQDLFNLVKDRGPLTTAAAWTGAQETGISGLKSKTHMKIMLKWMRGKKLLKQLCQHVGSSKKFLVATPEHTLPELPISSPKVKMQSRRPSKNGKKRAA